MAVLAVFVFAPQGVSAAKPKNNYKVSYKMGRMGGIALYIQDKQALVAMEFSRPEDPKREGGQQAAPQMPRMRPRPQSVTYADYGKNEWYKTETFPDGRVFTTVTKMKDTKDFAFVGMDTVMNIPCRHVKTSVNSNSIDIWYTDMYPVKGSPQPELGALDGIVLKIARNGRTMLTASSIEKLDAPGKDFPSQKGKIVSKAELKYYEDQLQVTTVQIFDGERISFIGNKKYSSFDDGIVYRVGGGTIILKKVALPEINDGDCIFAEVTQFSDGDAYDRTGSIFLVPTDKALSFLDAVKDSLAVLPAPFVSGKNAYPGIVSTDTYDVPVELVRFFTPFGIKKFNYQEVWGQSWADSAVYRQEITHFAPLLKGEVWIGAYIGNWDANGHILSLKFKYHPEEDSRPSASVVPLFNTLNLLEQAGQLYPDFMNRDSLHMKIHLDKPMKNAQLVYIATGHGGWGGGDEFNQKLNRIYVDGQLKFSYIPWRGDCATYRYLNPCSGNFSNGLSSSDLSRSNWCPGSVTQPAFIPVGDLEAGDHEFVVCINQGDREGSSISYWCLSGALITR